MGWTVNLSVTGVHLPARLQSRNAPLTCRLEVGGQTKSTPVFQEISAIPPAPLEFDCDTVPQRVGVVLLRGSVLEAAGHCRLVGQGGRDSYEIVHMQHAQTPGPMYNGLTETSYLEMTVTVTPTVTQTVQRPVDTVPKRVRFKGGRERLRQPEVGAGIARSTLDSPLDPYQSPRSEAETGRVSAPPDRDTRGDMLSQRGKARGLRHV
ncbi:hypothetical protein KIPB_006273 [Kipferlia bialata]|uniref:Uncharacterized protein n=1 Tax=Kipferlia bialata TaxID=797122 RepID=A0A9K3CYF7_9EUKA|nr:hypothetical protein KIPB_002658 [Kipferlia bialata]GIQ83189.1 hypothetical protein KIPB_004466 [Kipferlia bialata]GIQ83385.1 hypothetical protein KIPB_004696 [Kipferlia bialata]GIQ84725.1 hypothetical protein KIPB_006273 [Kipferlia bialata]|eukprot:g2658.t1